MTTVVRFYFSTRRLVKLKLAFRFKNCHFKYCFSKIIELFFINSTIQSVFYLFTITPTRLFKNR